MISPQKRGALPSNDRRNGYGVINWGALYDCFAGYKNTGDNRRGEPIYLPSSTLQIDRKLQVNGVTHMNNRMLYGDGPRASVIMATPDYHSTLLEFEDATYGRVQNIGFEGRHTNSPSTEPLIIARTWNFGFSNVNIRNSNGIGLYFHKSQRMWIRDSEVEFNKSFGIIVDDAAFVSIENVSVEGNGSAGCYIVGKREHRVKFPNHKIRGLYCENCPVGLILENVRALQTVEGIHCPVGIAIEGRSIEHCMLDARACQGDITLDAKCRHNTIIMSYYNDKCELHDSGFYNKVEMVGGYPS